LTPTDQVRDVARVLVTIVMFCTACGELESGASGDGARPSQEVLASIPDDVPGSLGPGTLAALSRWIVSPRPEIVLGPEAPDGRWAFGRVVGAFLLLEGGVAVADELERTLWVFNDHGHLQRRVGSPGTGPDEYQSVRRLVRDGSGSLGLWDPMRSVVTIVGERESSTRSPAMRVPNELSMRPELVGLAPTGSPVLLAREPVLPLQGSGMIVRGRIAVILLGEAGSHDTIPIELHAPPRLVTRSPGGGIRSSALPFSVDPVVTTGRAGVVVFDPEYRSLTAHAWDTDEPIVLDLNGLATPLDAAMRQARINNFLGMHEGRIGRRAADDAVPWTGLAMDGWIQDAEGRIWIRLLGPDLGSTDEGSRWLALSSALRPIATVDLPGNRTLVDASGRRLLTHSRGAFGSDRLEIWRVDSHQDGG
jgi:hypothetical protein